jgi:long-chain acyl-CoA synthetase
MGALCDPKAWTVDALGGIPACIEIKLVDFPDAGYYATNLPRPQGEIWIRGPSITDGYYQNEEETKAAFGDGSRRETLGSGTRMGISRLSIERRIL